MFGLKPWEPSLATAPDTTAMSKGSREALEFLPISRLEMTLHVGWPTVWEEASLCTKLLVMELGPGAHPRVGHPDGQTFWSMVHGIHHRLMPGPQCRWTPGRSVPLAYANIHPPRYMDFPSVRWHRPLHPAGPLCVLLDVFSHPSSGPAALRLFLGALPFVFLSSPLLPSPPLPFFLFFPFSSVQLLFSSCPFTLSVSVLRLPVSRSLLHSLLLFHPTSSFLSSLSPPHNHLRLPSALAPLRSSC